MKLLKPRLATESRQANCRALGLLLACWLALPLPALAQAFPSKPIRLIVGFSAGSGNDVLARDMARHMGETLGQPIVVENKVGGGGSLGTDFVAKAAPDGYTIGLGTSSQLVMNVGLYKNLPFDVDKDLQSVGLLSRTPLVLVGSNATPKTLKEVIAYARANPGKLSYGSAGAGSISHITGEAFAKAADIALLHVPYKGNAAALVDLASGHINLLFDGLNSSLPLAQQGRLQLLALSASQRSAVTPALPTFAEEGLASYQAYTWNNIFAPAKTPADVIEKLNAAVNKALATSAVKDRIAQSAAEPLGPSTPAQANAFGQAERARWVPFVRAMGLEVN